MQLSHSLRSRTNPSVLASTSALAFFRRRHASVVLTSIVLGGLLTLGACQSSSGDDGDDAGSEPATDSGSPETDAGATPEPGANPGVTPEPTPQPSPTPTPSPTPQPSPTPNPSPSTPPPPDVRFGEACELIAQNCDEPLVCGLLSGVCEETCETPGPCNQGADCCPISEYDCVAGFVVNFCTAPDGGVVIDPDAGPVGDGGVVDAGAVDAGADAGAIDAGVVDAGVVDAGVVDAG